MNTIQVVLLALASTPFVVVIAFASLRLIDWLKSGRHVRPYLKHECGHMHPHAARPRECPGCMGRTDPNNEHWASMVARQRLFGGYAIMSEENGS